ncbi:hypothetical protein JX265_013742 [Neoarthrinium moseri]|uniref:GH16 domain-containing protein n=1 Tax=Neoarthrinium moseri TaxID=1658444 RepID=A0A9P9W834_9PEZI|nr:hypothetical protein JX265_013742 [Neoarthrinium moseri]
MAPSLLSAVTGAAIFAAGAMAADQSYQITENWGANNFFNNFDFFEAGGFVNYVNETYARDHELFGMKDGKPFIGVEHKLPVSNSGPFGRASVRLESKKSFGKGLFVFDMAYLPKPVDGSWPAIWMYGDWEDKGWQTWPNHGDIDIYENWNQLTYNRQTLHTRSGCTVWNNPEMSATSVSGDCDSDYSGWKFGVQQWQYQGCSANDYSNKAFGDPNGGVYVVEYNSDHIKMWTFRPGNVPSDITSGNPDPSKWPGLPTFSTKGGDGSCDIDSHYGNQKIVLNLDFCGVAGNDGYWPSTETYRTKDGISCWDYVAANPSDFADVYFKFNSVKIYTLQDVTSSTSSSVSSTSTSSSASSASTSSVVTTSSATVSATGTSSSASTESASSTSSESSSGSVTESSTSSVAQTGTSSESSSSTDSASASSSSSATVSTSSSNASVTGSSSSSASASGSITGSVTVTASTSASASTSTSVSSSADEEYCEADDETSSSIAMTSTASVSATSASSTAAASGSVTQSASISSESAKSYTTSTVYTTSAQQGHD